MKFDFEIPDSDIDYADLWDETGEAVQAIAKLVVINAQGSREKMLTEESIKAFIALNDVQEQLYAYVQSDANTLAKRIAKIRQTGFHDNYEPKVVLQTNTVTVTSSYRYRGDSSDSITSIEFPLRYLWIDFNKALAEEQAIEDAVNAKLAAKALAETEKTLAKEAEKRRQMFEELKKEFEPK